MYVWILLLLAFSFIEAIKQRDEQDVHLMPIKLELLGPDLIIEEFPFSKSLGISLGKRIGRTLEDAQLEKDFKELYQDMMKVSEEIDKPEDLDEYVSHTDLTRLKNASHRRRSVLRSPAIKRRARSQSIRRQKLNSQSLRSHLQHSRQSLDEE